MRLSFVVAFLGLLAHEARGEETIYVASSAPFADPNSIAENVREECALPREQIVQLVRDTSEAYIPVVVDDPAVAAGKGRVLSIEITRAISKGAVYLPLGHSKEVAIRGRLLQDGVEVANFEAMRGSRGGLFGGLHSSCAVLHRCQDRLGTDVVLWLRSPIMGARLGEYGE